MRRPLAAPLKGSPAGEAVDEEALCAFMGRRAPGGRLSTQRRETDQLEILCGLINGITCGAPLTALIRNTDQRSKDYKAIADRPRPSHADLPAQVRYQGFQDVRGGGASPDASRLPICCAGGIALQILARRGIRVAAHLAAVGTVEDRPFSPMGETDAVLQARLKRELPVLSDEADKAMAAAVAAARKSGDSIGAVIEGMITGLPMGLGGPLFEGFDGALAFGLLAFQGSKAWSSATALRPHAVRARLRTTPGSLSSLLPGAAPAANHAGGIAGGMTTSAPILFRAAMKPTPSIALRQQTVSLEAGTAAELIVTGRHDPCIGIRAVPVVEAVAALRCPGPPPRAAGSALKGPPQCRVLGF